MLKNFLKTAWRGLLHNKFYGSLNILGLSAGMTVALLIGLWIHYQYSYDRWLPGHEQVYRACDMITDHGEKHVSLANSLPLVDALKKDVPGIKYVAATDWLRPKGLTAGDRKVYLPGAMAQKDFLQIFQYPMVYGDRATVLSDPYSIVLTESTAKALFGSEDPINKMVRIDNFNDLKVTGIMKDVPANSTQQFSFVVPYDYLVINDPGVKRASTSWGMMTSQLYVALEPNASYASVRPALSNIMRKHNPEAYANSKDEIILYAMDDWHLYSDFVNGVPTDGLITYVKIFGGVGVLVLLIACINFMNLSTARSEKRAKEVGIRKTMGSLRSTLVLQFICESVLASVIAGMISLVLVQLCLPVFNDLTGAAAGIDYSNPLFWMLMTGYILVTGLLAGSRPAFFLSRFEPVKVLKGAIRPGPWANLPRRALIVAQFSCSITLIICTIVVYQQVQYGKNRSSGYDIDRLVVTNTNRDLLKGYKALKNKLLQSGLVSAVTGSSNNITAHTNFSSMDEWPGRQPDEKLTMAQLGVADYDFFSSMGIAVLQGRDFRNETDTNAAILNETAVKKMRLNDPVGKMVTFDAMPMRVIGVVKDAVVDNPFAPATPAIFMYRPDWTKYISYRVKAGVGTQRAIAGIGAIFTKFSPSYPFQYKFIDEVYAAKFRNELLIGKLAGLFAVLAIFISCLGLIGLAAYMAERRRKEIGIRKVLGASVHQMWMMLSKEFMMLVSISTLIATPLAILAANGWLEKYSYRITVSPWIFVLTAAGGLIITIVAVSFQAIGAALSNPVKSLRTE